MTRKARLVSLVGAGVALALAALPEGLAGGAPRAGFWESAPLTQRGESASVIVRRVAGRTVVTDISTPAPDCRRLFGIFGEPGTRLPRLRVDSRGRFGRVRRAQTDGIAAIDGRFIGSRSPTAVLRARWHSGPCRASARFRLRPVRRTAVRDGTWTGPTADGGAITLEVVNTGREVYLSGLGPSPGFRCADGSEYRIADYPLTTELGWVRRDGSFTLRDAGDDRLVTMQGVLRGQSGSGSLRVIQSHADGRGVCDTGVIGFAGQGPPSPQFRPSS